MLDRRVIVGLPTVLQAESKAFMEAYIEMNWYSDNLDDAKKVYGEAQEEVGQKLGTLQDTCPGMFAHEDNQHAKRTIELLDLMSGTGLPQRY